MNIGKCKLCLKENAALLKKSHIIPDFFHKDLKDENNKYSLILPERFVKERKQHWKTPSGAMYDSDLLCEKCDNQIISKYETNLSSTLTANEDSESYQGDDDRRYKIYKNIDYKKYKLGWLSILWRASVSTSEMFREVNISADHCETLRLMILNDDAKDIEDYPMILYLFDKDDEKSILNPRFIDEDGFQYAKFILYDCMILFVIGKLPSISELFPYIPNHSGILHIPIKEKNYLSNYIGNIIIAAKSKLNNNQ